MSDYGTPPPPPPPPPPPAPGYNPPPAGGTPPPNYLVLAIVSLLCCWPVGIPAVVFAARVNGKYAQGDVTGAAEDSAKARKFAIIALALGIVGTIIYIILVAAGLMSSSGSM